VVAAETRWILSLTMVTVSIGMAGLPATEAIAPATRTEAMIERIMRFLLCQLASRRPWREASWYAGGRRGD
jgi:hypothetical protein